MKCITCQKNDVQVAEQDRTTSPDGGSQLLDAAIHYRCYQGIDENLPEEAREERNHIAAGWLEWKIFQENEPVIERGREAAKTALAILGRAGSTTPLREAKVRKA